MPQGDLHRLLNSAQDHEGSLDFIHITVAQRLSIVLDVADAYLQHNNQGTIVHCHMKPSNILLDDTMTTHVGDFGLARFVVDPAASSPDDSHSTSLIAINGTIGYAAPECATRGHVLTASDVYSFGIVVLEMFLRKRPTDASLSMKNGLKAQALISGDASQNYPKIVASSLRSSGVTAQGQPVCSVPVAWKMQKCRSRSSARKTWPCGSRSSIRLSLRAAIALCSATVLACTIVEQWRTKVLGSPSRPSPSGGLPDSSQERGAPARPLEQCSSVHGRILLDLWPPLHRYR